MKYIFTQYLANGSYENFEKLGQLLEAFMVLAIILIFTILIRSFSCKQKYQQLYRLTYLSMTYLCPVFYTVVIVLFRIYISIPFLLVFYCILRKIEAKELTEIADKYCIPSTICLKKSSLFHVVLITLLLIIFSAIGNAILEHVSFN